jgi:hypothetical protein
VTPDPTDEVYPPETETPVRVCMEQTQQTRIRCLMDIRRSNQAGSPTPPALPGHAVCDRLGRVPMAAIRTIAVSVTSRAWNASQVCTNSMYITYTRQM